MTLDELITFHERRMKAARIDAEWFTQSTPDRRRLERAATAYSETIEQLARLKDLES